MNSDIISIGETEYMVIRDEYFISIYDLPINYDEKPHEYKEYFLSLFKRQCSLFLSIYYNDLPHLPLKDELFIVNITNPYVIMKISNKLNLKINGRLYR